MLPMLLVVLSVMTVPLVELKFAAEKKLVRVLASFRALLKVCGWFAKGRCRIATCNEGKVLLLKKC